MNNTIHYRLSTLCAGLVILFSLNLLSLKASSPVDSLIAKGNGYYLQRHYQQSADCYVRVLNLGYESGELYYNLGNAYYKQNMLAEAILSYEKALLFLPGDEDVKQNLALANARIIDKIDSIPEFFMKRWVRALQQLFSPNQWAILAFITFLLSLAGFALFEMSYRISLKKAGFSTAVSLLIISLLGLLFMFNRIQQIERHQHAIIMTPSVNARSSPDEQSTNVFVLHEGTKVMVVDSVQDWKEIRIANGNNGWVPGNTLGEI